MNKSKKNFLLTDVLPYEVPLLFSNSQLCQYLSDNEAEWNNTPLDLNCSSVPYTFLIWKNEESKRTLSLLHPLAQLQLLKFIEIYDGEFIDFCNLYNIFSIRYPCGINSTRINQVNKLQKDLKSLLDEDSEYHNNEFEAYVDSYFNKKKFSIITYFFKSNLFKHLETKYPFMLKIDIQNCFEHIYTHSIDWAYLGDKELAKQLLGKKNRFSSYLDCLMQRINYNETNGIVVGPEFSRCVAEIILMRIDYLVYTELISHNLYLKKDYEVMRFIDDTFIYCYNSDTCYKIKAIYEEKLRLFKLDINPSKIILEKRPFLKSSNWVPKMRVILNQYFQKVEDIKYNIPTDSYKIKTLVQLNNTLIEDIRCIMIDYKDQIDKIVTYIFTFFDNNKDNLFNLILLNKENQVYFLCSIIDIFYYVLTFSITTQHVLKYISFMTKFYLYAISENSHEVINIIYKKSLELIKYNTDRNTELLNLIIYLRRLRKDLPENLLIYYSKNNWDYFNLAVMTFYISSYGRIYRYKNLVNSINDAVTEAAISLQEKYINNSNPNPPMAHALLSSASFYIIHDFYNNPIINSNTKNKIDEIKNWLSRVTWKKEESKIFLLFWNYVKDFDKPFMKFNSSDSDLVPALIAKSSKLDSRVSD
jgi:hypothetical protein